MHDCKWWGMMCHTSPLQCNHHNKFWIIGDTGQYWLFHLSQRWLMSSVLVSLPGYCEINDWPPPAPLQHRSIPSCFTQSYSPVIEVRVFPVLSSNHTRDRDQNIREEKQFPLFAFNQFGQQYTAMAVIRGPIHHHYQNKLSGKKISRSFLIKTVRLSDCHLYCSFNN